jgi:hypothetical protein
VRKSHSVKALEANSCRRKNGRKKIVRGRERERERESESLAMIVLEVKPGL